jgi:hypothetical protein
VKQHKLFLRGIITAYLINKKQPVTVARKLARASEKIPTLSNTAIMSDSERPMQDTLSLFLSTDVGVTREANLQTLVKKGERIQYLLYEDVCDTPEWFSDSIIGNIIGRMIATYWFLAFFDKDNETRQVLLAPTSADCWAFQDKLNRTWYVSSL